MRMLLKRLIPVLVLFVGTSAFAQFRIATVDVGRVFTNYWKTTRAQSAIDEMRTDFEKNMKERIDSFGKAKEEYQKVQDSVNDPAVSSEERDKRKRDAEDRLRDLKQQDDGLAEYDRGERARIAEQMKRANDNLLSDIRVVVKAKAQTDGYTLVIDTAAQSVSGSPIVPFYVPGSNDITDAVIKQLNAGAPVETPTAGDHPTAKDKTSGK